MQIRPAEARDVGPLVASVAAAGYTAIQLATHAKMTATQDFYRRSGWQETGRDGQKVYFAKQLKMKETP